ncbi:MAG: DUF362 domain-containing protein [Candidatus Helarchaeota archaeon]
MGTKVAIVKGENPSEMLSMGFAFFDNFQEAIIGKNVVIKPNLGAWSTLLPKFTNEWIVTSKDLLLALISFLKDLGATSVTVAESAFIDNDMNAIYKDMGLKKALKRQEVSLVDLSQGPFRKVQLFDNIMIELPELILNAECLINMPKLKTHGLTTVTLGVKNLKGTLSHQSKRIFHRKGLDTAIAHLTTVIKPTINIIDGLVGLEGFGPVQTGKPIKVGVLIIGDNVVATDAVAASIMGFNPREIPHLKLASELGNGPLDLSEIEILGESIKAVTIPFEPCPTGLAIYEYGSNIVGLPPDMIKGNYSSHWCSMCMMNFIGSLWALKDDCGTNYKQKLFVVSDQAEIPKEYEGKLILYGNCQARNRSKVGDHIFLKGCPPSQLSVYSTFGKLLYPRTKAIWGTFKRLFKTLFKTKLSSLEQWKDMNPREK